MALRSSGVAEKRRLQNLRETACHQIASLPHVAIPCAELCIVALRRKRVEQNDEWRFALVIDVATYLREEQ